MPDTSRENINPDMPRPVHFSTMETVEDVASLLDLTWPQLRYLLFVLPAERQYTQFAVSKKSGGQRVIAAPCHKMKQMQTRLNSVLQEVYKPKQSAHGFVQGRSVVTNATMHRRRRFVFNIDLQDFFPSINFGRVRGMFMAVPYSLNAPVATVLARICCFDGKLPQGAPTSPIVSNMVCARMDSQLQKLAKSHHCIYTRYADDITFSTQRTKFPVPLATINAAGQTQVGGELDQCIRTNGFVINQSKVRLQPKYHRQEVTGLITNRFPNVPRTYVRQIRAMLHALDRYGLVDAQQAFIHNYDKKRRTGNQALFLSVIRGKIEFLGAVKGKADPIYLKFCNELRRLAPTLNLQCETPYEEEPDQYSKYEDGMNRLLNFLGEEHPDIENAFILQQQLQENIEDTRRFSSTSENSAERFRIIARLTRLCRKSGAAPSFLQLCGGDD